MTDPAAEPQSHIDALIAKYARGRSIKEIERQHDLNEGALGAHLKPSQRGRFPRLNVQQRFADALDAPLREVSAAFAADSEMGLLEPDPLPPDCKELVDDYLALDKSHRALVRQVVRAVRDQQRAEHPESDPDHFQDPTVVDSTTRGTVDSAAHQSRPQNNQTA